MRKSERTRRAIHLKSDSTERSDNLCSKEHVQRGKRVRSSAWIALGQPFCFPSMRDTQGGVGYAPQRHRHHHHHHHNESDLSETALAMLAAAANCQGAAFVWVQGGDGYRCN
eukprot:1709423-Pleurochrysis_carterae.AAC.3